MPLRPTAFASLRFYNPSSVALTELRPAESAVDVDWGFDRDLPWDRLSAFARHMDTAAAIARIAPNTEVSGLPIRTGRCQ